MRVAYARAPDVVVTRKGERAFLTRLDTGDVFEANAVALLVFEAVGRGGTVEDAAAAVAGAFPDVPADEVRRDVEDVLAAFEASGLLLA